MQSQAPSSIDEYITLSKSLIPEDDPHDAEFLNLQEQADKLKEGPGESSRELLDIYSKLGRLCLEKGRFLLALQYLQGQCDIEKRLYKDTPIKLATSLYMLADLQLKLSMLKEVHVNLHTCLNLLESDPDSHSLLLMEVYRALCILEIENAKYDEALAFADKCESLLGRFDYPEEALKIKFAKIRLFGFSSDVKEMVELTKEVLQEYKHRENPTHSLYPGFCRIIAYSYYNQGKYSQSKEYHKEGLQAELQVGKKPVDYYGIIQSYLGLGGGLMFEGDSTQAMKLLNECQRLSVKLLGEETLVTALCINYMGKVYSVQCKFKEADDLLRKGLEINVKLFGEIHPRVAMSYQRVGELYLAKTEFSAAVEKFNKALEIQTACCKQRFHINFACIHHDLGIAYIRLRKVMHAQQSLEKALEIMMHLYGEDHPSIADYNGNLSIVYKLKGNRELQLTFLKKALKIQKKLLGKGHAKTAPAYENLGLLYNELKDYDKALKKLQRAIQIRKKTFDDIHPLVCDNYYRLAIIYKGKGDNSEAIKYLIQSMKIHLKFYPMSNQKTEVIFRMFPVMFNAVKDVQASKKYSKILLDLKKRQKLMNSIQVSDLVCEKQVDQVEITHNLI